MEIGDWITLLAVGVALTIGTASILQTRRIQDKLRRRALLNELIEWAIDILECNSPGNWAAMKFWVSSSSTRIGATAIPKALELPARFIVLGARANYVRGITSEFPQLRTSVTNVISELARQPIDLATASTTERSEELSKLTETLVDELTKIKSSL